MSDGVVKRKRKGRDVFLAQVRVLGKYRSQTFEDYQEARDWHDQKKAELKGDREALEPPKETKATSLKDACEWGIGKLEARKNSPNKKPNDKALRSKLRWWMGQETVVDISLATLNRFHLMDTINAAQAEGDGGTQTQIHRVNAISWLYREWATEHRITSQQLPNPAIDARPPPPDGRTRRCKDAIAARGVGEIDEESIVLAAAKRSTRKWLYSAIIISIDTAIRQAEQVGLRWPKVILDGPTPHIDLTAEITKTKEPRTVPLTARAVEAFRELKAQDE